MFLAGSDERRVPVQVIKNELPSADNWNAPLVKIMQDPIFSVVSVLEHR
jgi:hypothetical protein